MANKRVIAAAVVLVVGVGLFGAMIILQSQPQYETMYHFEANYPSSAQNIVVLRVDHLLDCNLTIKFVDNSTLWYSVNVELYESGPSIPVVETGDDNVLINQDATSPVRVKSLDITLGTGYPYRIAVGGSTEDESSNINAVLEINNGAMLGEYAGFNMQGDLHLSFGEDVDVSQGGYLVHTSGGIDHVHLMIDLPFGLNGRLDATSPNQNLTLLGWSLTDDLGLEKEYATSNVTAPMLHMDIEAQNVDGVLEN